MNAASARYQSFQRNGRWPHPTTFSANPLRLAQTGFFFQPVPAAPDRVACFCCGTAVARWKPRSDPRTEHLRYNPNCPFLNGNYNNFRFEAARLESFTKASPAWSLGPDFLAQPWRLAKAGFHYSPRPPAGMDRCECFCCGIALVRWEKGDDPWREHQKNSPACAFVRGLPTDNIILPASSELPAPERKSEMEELMEEIERLNIPYDADLPNSFLCPITQDIIRNPIVLEDGHTYEKAAIYQWLTSHNTSPLTNKPLASKLLFPNHALKAQLVEYAQKLLKDFKSSRDSPSAPMAPSGLLLSGSNLAGSSPLLGGLHHGALLPRAPSLGDSSAPELPASFEGHDQAWMDPLFLATDDVLSHYRTLQSIRQGPSSDPAPVPAPTPASSSSSDPEASAQPNDDSELSRAQQQFDLAESRLQHTIKEIVAQRASKQYALLLSEQNAALQAEADRRLSETAEQAAHIIQTAETTAEAAAKEKQNELADTNAALIASIEQLSRQRSHLQSQIDHLQLQTEQLQRSISSAAPTSSSRIIPALASAPPLDETSSPSSPSSSSSSSSSSSLSPSQAVSSSAPLEPSSSQTKKKGSFASFFGFS